MEVASHRSFGPAAIAHFPMKVRRKRPARRPGTLDSHSARCRQRSTCAGLRWFAAVHSARSPSRRRVAGPPQSGILYRL